MIWFSLQVKKCSETIYPNLELSSGNSIPRIIWLNHLHLLNGFTMPCNLPDGAWGQNGMMVSSLASLLKLMQQNNSVKNELVHFCYAFLTVLEVHSIHHKDIWTVLKCICFVTGGISVACVKKNANGTRFVDHLQPFTQKQFENPGFITMDRFHPKYWRTVGDMVKNLKNCHYLYPTNTPKNTAFAKYYTTKIIRLSGYTPFNI